VDDIPPMVNELCLVAVTSPIAAGRIANLDISEAAKADGAVIILTRDSLPGSNLFGGIIADEPIFPENGEILYIGQPVAVIAATSLEAAHAARKLVKLEIEASTPILTIEEAIKAERFLGWPFVFETGDAPAAVAAAPCRLTFNLYSNGQEQFYLESQSSIAYPDKPGFMRLICSTQNPAEIQHVVAHALGWGENQVEVVVPRMGGGFGGKETQAALPAVFAALVAHLTGRPARMVLDKTTDMIVTGKRHPFLGFCEIGFTEAGEILGWDVKLYSDGGCSADLSTAVLQRAMYHIINAYGIPNVRVEGHVCFTNHPSNTAFRGFGGPQGMTYIECAIQAMAEYLNMDAWDIRRRNLICANGINTTHYGQTVEGFHLDEIMDRLEQTSDYRRRVADLDERNAKDRIWVRGIAGMPVLFGISFTFTPLNQANALIHLGKDGSIQVSICGTEMGQGLFTKIRQIVALKFGVNPSKVEVLSTSTARTANGSATAASASTDLNGAAAEAACDQILAGLGKHFADLLAEKRGAPVDPARIVFQNGYVLDPGDLETPMTLGAICASAWFNRISLGALGFYATPKVHWDMMKSKGSPFYYYTQGAAVAEVAVNRFTGELTVDALDVLIDIGRSINPMIDRGQVIGGIVQGLGWLTMENLVWDAKGHLLSNSPTTYKIPAITDVPKRFIVEFAEYDNPGNVLRSKAVGEPPVMHAIPVWLAARNALYRIHPHCAELLQIPATGEEMLRCISEAPVSAPVEALQPAPV